jgi:hypothetical protein
MQSINEIIKYIQYSLSIGQWLINSLTSFPIWEKNEQVKLKDPKNEGSV